MYVAVKGGERAILNSYRMLNDYRRGDRGVPALSLAQIREQMPLAVSRVMAEGSLYDPHLAALAIKQAAGDVTEAVFLLRAYRTTLPRFGYTTPLDTADMRLQRRISSTFKDVPGGQVLGPTYDYTQRLLDFTLEADRECESLALGPSAPATYGGMQVRLYEDIAWHGRIATTYDYPVMVNDRYMMRPSPIPEFDNPKLNRSPALMLFGAGTGIGQWQSTRSPGATTAPQACHERAIIERPSRRQRGRCGPKADGVVS